MAKAETQKFDIGGCTAGIIGCGGLGCNVIAHLAGAGIGRLVLCDFDTVSESNLNRQFLYRQEDLGKSKCLTAAAWIRAYSPETEVICREGRIESEADMETFAGCDIIILCADNAAPRLAANAFCGANGIPLVCGVIDGFYGMAYMYVPGASPCLDCAGLTAPSEIHSSVSAAAGIIGALEATLAEKYLIGADRAGGKLHIYDNDEITKLTISPAKGCGVCRKTAQEDRK